MLKKVLPILKLCFVIFLYLLFLIHFGLPSLKLYLKKGILVSESIDVSIDGKIAPPAITICAQNKESDFGWNGLFPASVLLSEHLFIECFALNLRVTNL